MRFSVIATVAAVLLLGACSEDPKPAAATGGTGTQTTPSTTTRSGPVAGSREDFQVNVGDRVFFAYDQFDLSAEARRTLDRQAAWLKQYANYRITVEGHADERGTREYNQALGDRRANAVKNYMVANGVPAARLSTVSFGKERPAVVGSNETAYAQNRRGVTTLN
jgi:peptidoglycan-associated lipoprotein